jgi:single-strand DNA-binding protein
MRQLGTLCDGKTVAEPINTTKCQINPKGDNMSANTYTITGRLGRDVDLRFSPNGVAVASLNTAVSRRKKDGNDWKEETVWMEVKCFGQLAEYAAESLSKGDEIIAQGYVEEPRTYEKKDGTIGVSLPFIANDLGFSLRWGSVVKTGISSSRKPPHLHKDAYTPERMKENAVAKFSDEPF